ncbi:MAG: ferrichrome ABC transporter permease, partial [Deltaproteobacteria bacterium]|nr:ferrichrome ABC transporter permease [Deltaproteobacteria bacterium]
SLVACFASKRLGSRWWAFALFAVVPLYGVLLIARNDLHIALQLTGYCTVLLAVCMVCHGELVRLRPEPSRLTSFYLCVALGGALGSAFVALLAPLLFDDFHELPLGLALAWILAFVCWLLDKRSALYGRRTLLVTFVVALALTGLGAVQLYAMQGDRVMLETRRSFFGVLWVGQLRSRDPRDTVHALGHGVTVHGTQLFDEQRRREPTTYYGPKSGVGVTLLNLPREQDAFKVGVIGLGVGTLATYGTEGDVFRFYELNPDVIRLARGEGSYFSFLSSTPATVEIIEGDARLSMELEAERGDLQGYHVLVLDAFSSHAIPVHLLTRDCFEIYLKHLAQNGVIAAHIGNPHVNLLPVLARLADHFGLEIALVEHRGDDHVRYDSQWVLLTRDKRFFEIPGVRTKLKALDVDPDDSPLWTDDYSNPLGLMY